MASNEGEETVMSMADKQALKNDDSVFAILWSSLLPPLPKQWELLQERNKGRKRQTDSPTDGVRDRFFDKKKIRSKGERSKGLYESTS